MDKATKRPWIEYNERFASLDVGERPIAIKVLPDLGREIASRFNLHDKLVEALRDTRAYLIGVFNYGGLEEAEKHPARQRLNQLEAILKECGGA